MDKRLITSIEKNIAKLDDKIMANDIANADMKNRRDKFREMLDMLTPQNDLPTQAAATEPAATQPGHHHKEVVPAFLGKKE